MRVEASKKFHSGPVSDILPAPHLASVRRRPTVHLAQDTFCSSSAWHTVAHRGTLVACPTITPSASRQEREHDSPSTRVALGCLSGRSPSDTSKRGSGTTHTR
jgi:hypothetical protein